MLRAWRERRAARAAVGVRGYHVLPPEPARDRVCPHCHYIGPPLLCGCVTRLFDALREALQYVPAGETADALVLVASRHYALVSAENAKLRASR